MTRVVVYGATGTTGRLVAERLVARGLEVVLAGRDPARLRAQAEALPVAGWRAARPEDAAALAAALRGARLVVSCAGPFVEVGEPVLAAAIEAGAHYLDTSGEQAFLRAAYERFDAPARRAAVCAIPGVGFESLLGDLAAGWAAAALSGAPDDDAAVRGHAAGELAADDPLDEVAVSYVVDRFVPTAGTQRSALASLPRPGVTWRDGRWDPVPPAAERRRIDAGPAGTREVVSFPSGEVITVPRHVAARRVQTFVSLGRSPWATRALGVAAAALPLLARLAGPRLGALVDPVGPDAAARAAAEFTVHAVARRRAARATTVVSGRDVYATTAAVVGWLAQALATRPGGPCGVLAPGEALAPAPALRALAAAAELTLAPPRATR